MICVLANSFSFVLGQNQPAGNHPVDAIGGINTVWDFAMKGGPIMIPIGLVSIVALTIIVERAIHFRRKRVIPPDFLPALSGMMGEPQRAIDYCKANGSPIANILLSLIKRGGQPREALEKQAEESGQREVTKFKQHMRLLSALPQASTMLGLLGTVFGMIRTFQSVAASGEALGKTEMLAKGIYEAWTATAGGLLVAIPVLIAYQMLQAKIDARVADLDAATLEWIEQNGVVSGPSVARAENVRGAVAPAAATIAQEIPSAAAAVTA